MNDANLLLHIPMFQGLGADALDYLFSMMSARAVDPLETIFWVGDGGKEMFIIQSGYIEICIPDQGGKDIRLAVLGPGEFFGEISLLDHGPRTATARAIEHSSLLVLGMDAFHRCMIDFPTVAVSVVTALGRRQRSVVEKLRGIRNLNEVIAERLTPWQKLANAIATMAASQRFLMTHAVCFMSWIAINLLLRQRAIDPFPFPFLCFWASVEAIFLSLFILISQAMQGQKDRVRNEVEYQVAMKMQLELMQLHQKMDLLVTGRERDPAEMENPQRKNPETART